MAMKQTSLRCIILLKHLYRRCFYDTFVSTACQGGHHENGHENHRSDYFVIAAVVATFVIKGLIEAKKTSVKEDYYTESSSSAPLEQKFSQPGEYEVSSFDDPSDNETIKKVRFWYPSELAGNDEKYPVIVVVNASGTPAFKYEPWFKRLASWGFIVVGNVDPQAGSGETTSIMFDYLLNLPQDHKLNGRLDTENIGIVGFSQGGAGALAAVTMYDNG